MLVMYDSTDINAMPSDGDIYAGYVDGMYATFNAVVAKFPGKVHIPITVFGAPNVKVADCETGDLTPAQAAAWAKKEITAGRRPTIYCNTSTHPSVVAELLGVGLAFVTDVDWWCAQYDGVPTLPAGAVAKQYQSTTDLDTSVVDPSWIGQPTPPAPTPTEENMAGISPRVQTADGQYHRASVFLGKIAHSWLGPDNKWRSEDIAKISDPSNGPIANLTFDQTQVPTCQVFGNLLVIGGQTVTGGTSFEFVQANGNGWGAAETV